MGPAGGFEFKSSLLSDTFLGPLTQPIRSKTRTGVVAFCAEAQKDAVFAAMQARAHPTVLSSKLYKDPVTVAAAKYPRLDWQKKSHMPTSAYVEKLAEVERATKQARGSKVAVRDIDTVE